MAVLHQTQFTCLQIFSGFEILYLLNSQEQLLYSLNPRIIISKFMWYNYFCLKVYTVKFSKVNLNYRNVTPVQSRYMREFLINHKIMLAKIKEIYY